MYAMHEALARERMRELAERSHRQRLAEELAASRRWRLRELRAHAAHLRHSGRARRAEHPLALGEAR